MAYPRHWLFVMGGQLNEAGSNTWSEIWQCTMRGVPGVNAAYGSEQACLENIAPAIVAWFGAAENRLSATSRLTYLKLNEIAPDGSYAQPVSHTYNTTVTPGYTNSQVPGILTSVVSWTTGAVRGYAHRGRMYPTFALNQRPGMTLTSDEQTVFAGAGQRLLDALSASAISTPPVNLRGVAPRVVSSHGVIREVTGVSVGSVIDVQRRRKNQLRESYVDVGWPAV